MSLVPTQNTPTFSSSSHEIESPGSSGIRSRKGRKCFAKPPSVDMGLMTSDLFRDVGGGPPLSAGRRPFFSLKSRSRLFAPRDSAKGERILDSLIITEGESRKI